MKKGILLVFVVLFTASCGLQESPVDKGEDLLIEGNVLGARTLFRKAISRDPLSVPANFYLAIVEPWAALASPASPLKQAASAFMADVKESYLNSNGPTIQSHHPLLRLLVTFQPAKYLMRVENGRDSEDLHSFLLRVWLPSLELGIAHASILYRNERLRYKLDAKGWGISWLEEGGELDYGDALLLKSMLYALKAATYFLLSYTVDDFGRVAARIGTNSSPRFITAVIKDYPNLLKLRPKPYFNEFREAMNISMDSLKEGAVAIEKESNDPKIDDQRDDLVPQSKLPVKLTETGEDLKASLEKTAEIRLYVKRERQTDPDLHKIKLDLSRLTGEPISDLKVLLPDKFTSEGRVASYPDPRFHGIFPEADGVQIFCQVAATSRWCP